MDRLAGPHALKELTIKNLAAAARVTVACAGPGCPFTRKRAKVAAGKAKLTRLFGHADLEPGTRVELRMTFPT